MSTLQAACSIKFSTKPFVNYLQLIIASSLVDELVIFCKFLIESSDLES
jgi:hypothetical protein